MSNISKQIAERLFEKHAKILDIAKPKVREAFQKFLAKPNVIGHRTTAGKEVVEQGAALSSAELHRKGLLKDVETGTSGERQKVNKNTQDEAQKHTKEDVYASKGGLLDDDSYGDTGILTANNTHRASPFMNLFTNEVVVPPQSRGKERPLRIGKGYVLAPRKKVEQFNKARPEFKYIPTEDLDAELKKQVYLPAKSVKEVMERWVPSFIQNKLEWPT